MAPLNEAIIAALLIFCRAGACIMTLPGFSNEHIPMRVRLYIAIGASAPLALEMGGALGARIAQAPESALVLGIISELVFGALLGFFARLFMLSLETLATAIVTAIGIGNVMGAPLNESEPSPAMATFIVFGATTMIFVTDLHWELLRGLHQSYDAIPALSAPNGEGMVRDFLGALQASWLLAFRIASPFLLFSLLTNLGFGFLSRMAPQMSVYFLAAPLLMIFGVYWFYSASSDFFTAFSAEAGGWLAPG